MKMGRRLRCSSVTSRTSLTAARVNPDRHKAKQKRKLREHAYPDRAGARPLCNGGSRALPRATLDRAGVSHWPMGFFLAFRKAPMLPFVLFYSVNNPS